MKRTAKDEEKENENEKRKKKTNKTDIVSLPYELLENILRFSNPGSLCALSKTMKAWSKLPSNVYKYHDTEKLDHIKKNKRFNHNIMFLYTRRANSLLREKFGETYFSMQDLKSYKELVKEYKRKLDDSYGIIFNSDVMNYGVSRQELVERTEDLESIIQKIENNKDQIERVEKIADMAKTEQLLWERSYALNRTNKLAIMTKTLGLDSYWTVIWDGEITHWRISNPNSSHGFNFESGRAEKISIAHFGSKKVGKEILDSFVSWYGGCDYSKRLEDWVEGEIVKRCACEEDSDEYLLYMECANIWGTYPVAHTNNAKIYCLRSSVDRKSWSTNVGRVVPDIARRGSFKLDICRSILCMMADTASRIEKRWIKYGDIARDFDTLFKIRILDYFK